MVRQSETPRDHLDETTGVRSISLTQREMDVLVLLPMGHSSSAISRRLNISQSTTKNHLTSIFRKLGVTNRMEAVGCAIALGLIKRGQ
jgi:two-component system response regulator DegU